MATSGQRREVAERLRDLPRTADADGCCTAWDVLFALGMERCDAIGFVNAIDAQRFADLIDPTCKLRFDSVHQDFVCTHCGAWFDGFQTYNGHGKWNDMRYCPNCGARVVRAND